MTGESGAGSRSEGWPGLLELVESLGLSILVGVAGIAPRLLPFALAVWAVFVIAVALAERRLVMGAAIWLATPARRWSLALAVLLIASALWAIDASMALATALPAALLVLLTPALADALQSRVAPLDGQGQRRYVRALPLGFAVGLLFVAIEVGSDGALTRATLDVFPQLAGERGKGVVREAGEVIAIADFYLNRQVAALVVLLPLVLSAFAIWLPAGRRWPVALGAVGLLALVCAASAADSAKLALPVLLLVLAVAQVWPHRARQSLIVFVVLGLFLALPLARLPQAVGLTGSEALALSFRERARMWNDYAGMARERPLLGHGVEAARALAVASRQAAGTGASVEPSEHARRPGWHAHNFALQIWLELGLLGVLVVALAAAALVAACGRMGPRLTPFALATVGAVLGTSLGWGLWQEWYVAQLVLAAASFPMLATIARQRRLVAEP